MSAICPECARVADEYTYTLSEKHASVLEHIFDPRGVGEPVNYQQLYKDHGTIAPNFVRQGVSEAKYWGFVELLDKRGVWAYTEVGEAWLTGDEPAPAWVRTFGNRVVARASSLLYVSEVPLPRRISYDEAKRMASPHLFDVELP